MWAPMNRALCLVFLAAAVAPLSAQNYSTEDSLHRQVREDRERREAVHEKRKQNARTRAAESRAAAAEATAQDALDRVDELYQIEARRRAEAAARAAAEAKAKEEREREKYRAELDQKRERFYAENRAAAMRRAAVSQTTNAVGPSEANPAISYLIRARADGSYLVKLSHSEVRTFANEKLACAYIDGALGVPTGTTLAGRQSARTE